MLKNKYDLKLCQSHLHTVFENFVHHKKLYQVGFSKFFTSVASILRGVFYTPKMVKSKMPTDKFILFVSQHKALSRSLHTEFTQIGGLLFNVALVSLTKHRTESLRSWSRLLDNWYLDTSLSYLKIGWTQNFLLFLFLRREKTTNSPSLLEDSIVLFCKFFCNELINTHCSQSARVLTNF